MGKYFFERLDGNLTEPEKAVKRMNMQIKAMGIITLFAIKELIYEAKYNKQMLLIEILVLIVLAAIVLFKKSRLAASLLVSCYIIFSVPVVLDYSNYILAAGYVIYRKLIYVAIYLLGVKATFRYYKYEKSVRNVSTSKADKVIVIPNSEKGKISSIAYYNNTAEEER